MADDEPSPRVGLGQDRVSWLVRYRRPAPLVTGLRKRHPQRIVQGETSGTSLGGPVVDYLAAEYVLGKAD